MMINSPQSLKASTGPDVTKYLQVIDAGLVEELLSTNGFLKIQNTSEVTLDNVVLYAEYFDHQGRLCFSMVFSQSSNVGDDRTPIVPGAVRTLYSSNTGMMPASPPTGVDIHLFRQGSANQNSSQADAVALQAPVTLSATVGLEQASLQLQPELASAKRPILDLLLAKVSVDERGQIREVRILNSATSELESWFHSFVRELIFYPATKGPTPEASDILVNVQAMLSKDIQPGSLDLVSPWS